MIEKQNKKNFIWNVIGTTINSFLSLFYLIIVTRINGVNISGLFSYCFSISFIWYSLALYIGRIYQVSDVKNEFNDNTYYSLKIVSSLATLLIILVFVLLNRYDLFKCLIIFVFALTRIVEAFSDAIHGVFHKNNRLDLVGKSMALKSILSLIVFFIIDYFTKNIMVSVISILIVNMIIHMVYDLIIVKKYDRIKIEFNDVWKLIYKTKYLFITGFIIIIIMNLPRYMVDIFLNDKDQGYFGIIMMIPTVMFLFGQFIIQPMINSFTELFNKKDKNGFNKKVGLSIKLILLISLICICCAYFLGPEVLSLLYNINFDKYRLVLVLMIIGGLFYILSSLYTNILTIMRKIKIQFYVYLVVLVIGISISYVLSKQIKFYGVFYSYVIIMFIQYILFYLTYKHYLKKGSK